MRPTTQHSTITKNSLFDTLFSINSKGGPDLSEYSILNECINAIPSLLDQNIINKSDLETIKDQCEFLKTDISIMGHIKTKPFGYAGDFWIIERIYESMVSKKYSNWDHYSIINPAAEAVRNRKQYFKKLILEKLQEKETIHLLNIASGPARDLKEVYDEINPDRLKTTCIEIDPRAIEYAQKSCSHYLHNIEFINKNVFKFHTANKYDLIWSAGLFDYFDDRTFIQLLKRLFNYVTPSGEIGIGNFSDHNPGRVFMEVFGEWFLHHRSEEDLIQLATQAGGADLDIRINHEPLKVNLFLHLKNNLLSPFC